MKITWYGNASLKIESGKTSILIDPFVPIPPSPVPITINDFYGVDNILVTHGHFDHILDIPKLCEKESVRVMATATPINTLIANGVKPNQLREVKVNDEFDIDDVHIKAYRGKHVRLDYMLIFGKRRLKNLLIYFSEACKLLKLNRDYPENGETLIYEIEAEGRRIMVMGSLGIMDNVEYPSEVDLLVLPYQGTHSLLDISTKIIDRIKPKTVLLDHYDNTFPPITTNENTQDIKNVFAGKIAVLTIPYRTPITI